MFYVIGNINEYQLTLIYESQRRKKFGKTKEEKITNIKRLFKSESVKTVSFSKMMNRDKCNECD